MRPIRERDLKETYMRSIRGLITPHKNLERISTSRGLNKPSMEFKMAFYVHDQERLGKENIF